MTFAPTLSATHPHQPRAAGTIGYDATTETIVLAWNNGNRDLALSLADAHREAARRSPATQTRKDAQE